MCPQKRDRHKEITIIQSGCGSDSSKCSEAFPGLKKHQEIISEITRNNT